MTDAPSPLSRVGAVLLPASGLPALSAFRTDRTIRVQTHADGFWVAWPSPIPGLTEALLAVVGSVGFREVEGEWYPLGSRLPRAGLPPSTAVLAPDRVIVPEGLDPRGAAPEVRRIAPVGWSLVASDRPTTATALIADIGAVLAWVMTVSNRHLLGIRAASNDGKLLLLGPDLPLIPGCVRYSGERLLVPLGMRPEPNLSEEYYLLAAGVEAGDRLIAGETGLQRLADDALMPLTRAGLRSLL